MTLLELFGIAAGCAFGFYLALWLVSAVLGDTRLMRPCWGLGIALLATVLLACADGAPLRVLVLWVMALTWGARATLHAFWRRHVHPSARGPAPSVWEGLLLICLPLGGCTLLAAMPLVVGMHAPEPATLGPWEWLGVAVFAVGFVFEARADYELAAFVARAGSERVCRRGPWRFSRRPQAFGQCLVWWGFFLVVALVPLGYGALGAVVALSLILGRPRLELDRQRAARDPAYERYAATTSAFVPWPPRRAPAPRETERLAAG